VTPDECISEDVVAQFIEGSLEGERLASAEKHIASCEACMSLVAEVGTALTGDDERSPSDGEPSEPPLLVRGVQVGRYVIEGPVGSGGMGRVYAAHDPALDRKVALKLLHRYATAPELEARLLREAQAMARLAHPEVITVHDVGRFGEQLFIAMEFVDGGTLRDWLATSPRSWREVLAVFSRAGRGLASAHAAGIIHRDFKPDNVLVGTDGRVRVTDFGLAQTARDAVDPHGETLAAASAATFDVDASAPLTRTGMFVGTPAYMAPEQLRGEAADARSDLYGFSVALWEALYGERPYRGASVRELQADKVAGKPRATKRDARVPQRVRRALLGGLQPQPGDRYTSMDALLTALERASRAPRGPILVGAILLAALAWMAFAFASHRGRAPVMAPVVAGCTSNAACVDAHGGAPWICRASDQRCVAIASEDCTPLFDPADLRDDGTVWLGALFPMKGPSADAFGKMNLDAVDLARSEVAATTRALAGSGASVHVRRIALVGCDDSVDAMRAAKHLAEDVGVPAILGFRSGKEVVDVAGSLLIQHRILTMATLTESPTITRLPQPADLPRMVWRTTNNFEETATATARFLHDILEPRAKTKPTRVVLVRKDDPTSLVPFAETFYRTLVIDDRPAADSGSAYQEIPIAQSDAGTNALTSAAARIAAASPTFVVLYLDASNEELVESIEAQWPAGVPRPTYVIGENTTSILHDFLGTSAERRRRVFSTSPIAMPTATGRFLMRFAAAHPNEATLTLNPSSSYDGFYALAYAAFAIGDEKVTGPAMARGLSRLAKRGQRIESGPTDLFAGITALTRGGGIDLDGPSGELDFDPATGELSNGFVLLCPGIDPAGRASGDVASGAVFVAGEPHATGKPRCP
jgi:hypothetical protein